MTDPEYSAIGKLVTPDDDKESTESPSQTTGGTPGTIEDFFAQQPHGGQGLPTPEDMASTNTSNAEARAKAIADGMDEGTANIVYPDFSTPEDMLKIN